MKKIFALVLVLALLLSACGWSVEIVDPRDETEKQNITGQLSEEELEKYLKAINQIEKTRFFVENDPEAEFVPLYKELSEELYWDKTPDLLIPAEDYNPEKYPEYYTNQMLELCSEITNFKSEQEIADYLGQWVSPELFDNDEFKNHILEFEGKAYLLRFSRGYGNISYKNAEIICETESEIVAKAVIYSGGTSKEDGGDEIGTLHFVLEKNKDGKWLVTSLEEFRF